MPSLEDKNLAAVTRICPGADLLAGERGFRFKIKKDGKVWPAFVVRHTSGVSAYINRCSHLALELDWDPGIFFDIDNTSLTCATHGALYAADTGECIGGPCAGQPLESINVGEDDQFIILMDIDCSLTPDDDNSSST